MFTGAKNSFQLFFCHLQLGRCRRRASAVSVFIGAKDSFQLFFGHLQLGQYLLYFVWVTAIAKVVAAEVTVTRCYGVVCVAPISCDRRYNLCPCWLCCLDDVTCLARSTSTLSAVLFYITRKGLYSTLLCLNSSLTKAYSSNPSLFF